MDTTVELQMLWRRILANRRTIILLVAASTILVGIVSFLLPPWYRATASLLPPSEEDAGFGLASLLRGFGVPGVKVATQTAPAEVFLAVIQSERINQELVQRFDLKRLYHKRFMVDAVAELHAHARFEITEAGTIRISVEDMDPKRAADMANAYVEILDRFNREMRMTKGRRTRLFVENRLAETRTDLAVAEQKLAVYESQHKAVALSPEMSSAIETASQNYAQRSALQVRLGIIRGYTKGRTDEEQQILQHLAQLDRQMETLPTTGLELARLIRDVKTSEQLYILLTAQYEDARINEVRDVPTVEPLDVATPPERKSRPKRGIMIVAAFLLSLGAGVSYAVVKGEVEPRELPQARASD